MAQNNFVAFASAQIGQFKKSFKKKRSNKSQNNAHFRALPPEVRREIYRYLSDFDLNHFFEADQFLFRKDGYECVKERIPAAEIQSTTKANGYVPALLKSFDPLGYEGMLDGIGLRCPGIYPYFSSYSVLGSGRQVSGTTLLYRDRNNVVVPIGFSPDGRILIAKRFVHYDPSNSYSWPKYKQSVSDPTYWMTPVDDYEIRWRSLVVAAIPTIRRPAEYNELKKNQRDLLTSQFPTVEVAGIRYINFTDPVFFADGLQFLARAQNYTDGKILDRQIIGLFSASTFRMTNFVEITDAAWPESVCFPAKMDQVYFRCKLHKADKSNQRWVFWDRKEASVGLQNTKRFLSKRLILADLSAKPQYERQLATITCASERYLDGREAKKVVMAPGRQIACVLGGDTHRIVAVDLRFSVPQVYLLLQGYILRQPDLFLNARGESKEPLVHFSPDGNIIGIVARISEKKEARMLFSAHDHFTITRYIFSKNIDFWNATGAIVPSSDSVRFIVSDQGGIYYSPNAYLMDARHIAAPVRHSGGGQYMWQLMR